MISFKKVFPPLIFFALSLLILWGGKFITPSKAAPSEPKKTTCRADGEVFGLTKIWNIHLKITAEEWKTLEPQGGFGPPGGRFGPPGQGDQRRRRDEQDVSEDDDFPGGPPPGPIGPESNGPNQNAVRGKTVDDVHKSSGFGREYPWVHCEFSVGDQKFKNVGIRYKGNFSYQASASVLKRSFKIGLDHYGVDQRFRGLKKLNLNSGVTDPARTCESLAFAVYRAAGVPASQTAFALVELTVPEKYDREFVGVYTLIEQVDKTFLKERFGNAKGLLLKPEGVHGIEYLGDNWSAYEGKYLPKTKVGDGEHQRLIDFARLINKADDEQFRREIGGYLDIDEFLRFIAATGLLSSADSFLGMGHNYYLYLRPDNRFVFIPWDLDFAFGRGPMGGNSTQQTELSIEHPHSGTNKLIDRLLKMDDVREQYKKILKELSDGCFSKETLIGELDSIEKTIEEPLEREKKSVEVRKDNASHGGFGGGPPGGGMFGGSMPLRTFIEKRTESVAMQVTGKSKGYVPTGGFGPGGGRPGGPGGRPGRNGLGMFLAMPLKMTLDDDQDGNVTKDELIGGIKKFFDNCIKDESGLLDEKTLAEEIDKLLVPPPGFEPPGGFGPPGEFGPPGGGPPSMPNRMQQGRQGKAIAAAILKRADKNGDGRVSLDELLSAAASLFDECDKDKNSKLDHEELVTAVNSLVPSPEGLRQPGRNRGDGSRARPPRDAEKGGPQP